MPAILALQAYPQLWSDFEIGLGCTRPYLKKIKMKNYFQTNAKERFLFPLLCSDCSVQSMNHATICNTALPGTTYKRTTALPRYTTVSSERFNTKNEAEATQ